MALLPTHEVLPSPEHRDVLFPRTALEQSLADRFGGIARRHADRPAVESADLQLTYGQLDAASDRLGARIAQPHEPTPDQAPVALFLEQGPLFVVAMMATLKAGRVFVPLDAQVPAARNAGMLADSGARLVISRPGLADAARALDAGVALLLIDEPTLLADASTRRNARCDANAAEPGGRFGAAGPDALAYVLYTSGSTGKPKGVMHTHRSTMHNTLRHVRDFRITPDDRQSLLYPTAVYGGIRDIFNALLTGATLCHYPLYREGVGPLGDWLDQQRVSIYCSVATVFRQLARTLGDRRLDHVRLIKLGGEAVYGSDVTLVNRHFGPHCQLSCGLGATEVGGVRQFFVDRTQPPPAGRVGCGYPVEDVDVLILDHAGRPLADGQVGEIALRSRYLARGYWRRPEQTAERFVADPDKSDVPVYRTGDRGRLEADGHLVHLGRLDRQVKVHGYRVELADVEAALIGVSGVDEAVVLCHAQTPGHAALYSYVVDTKHRSAADLTEAVRSVLPPHMVPRRMLSVDRLPLLPNGKIDRASLQARLADDLARIEAQAVQAPTPPDASPTEQAVAEVVTAILGRRVDPRERLLAAGLDSLQIVDLMARLDQRFGRHLPLNTLVEAPTIAQLAARIEAQGPVRDTEQSAAQTPTIPIVRDVLEASIVPLRESGSRPPLHLVAPAGGSVVPFMAVAEHLGADQPLMGLQTINRTGQRLADLDIEQFAEAFTRCLLNHQPQGPYRLGGWSFGGFVAYAVADRLQRLGHEVNALIIIESDARLALHSWEQVTLWQKLKRLGELVVYSSPYLWQEARLYITERWSRRRPRNDKHTEQLRVARSHLLGNVRAYIDAIFRYEPPATTLDLHLLHSGTNTSDDELLGWQRFTTGRIRRHAITGNHFSIFSRRHVGALAEQLRVCLNGP